MCNASPPDLHRQSGWNLECYKRFEAMCYVEICVHQEKNSHHDRVYKYLKECIDPYQIQSMSLCKPLSKLECKQRICWRHNHAQCMKNEQEFYLNVTEIILLLHTPTPVLYRCTMKIVLERKLRWRKYCDSWAAKLGQTSFIWITDSGVNLHNWSNLT